MPSPSMITRVIGASQTESCGMTMIPESAGVWPANFVSAHTSARVPLSRTLDLPVGSPWIFHAAPA